MTLKGVTLIELLVVIAIIAMLIMILMPVLYSSRNNAKVLICQSNIRQICFSMLVYEQNNHIFPFGFSDAIPVSSSFPGSASRDLKGIWWFNLLMSGSQGSIEQAPVLWCPVRNVSEPFVLCGNYGVNRSICLDQPNPITGKIKDEFVGNPLTSSQIHQPAQTLLLIDSGYSLISWRGAINVNNGPRFENPKREPAFYIPGLEINEQRKIAFGFEKDALNGRHPNKKINIGFADGHISHNKAKKLLIEKTATSYTNLSPLWLAK